MGMALILECMVIMHWLEGRGLGPVGLTGFSMGGHVSCVRSVCVQSILCLLLDFFSDEFVMRFYVCVIELFAGSCSLA